MSARYIRFYKVGTPLSTTINLAEVVVWSGSFPDINLASGTNVTCSPACTSNSWNAGIARLVDGGTTHRFHTCYEGTSDTRGGLDVGECLDSVLKEFEMDLGDEYLISSILIVNRLEDQYRARAGDLRVDFKDTEGRVVLTTSPISHDITNNDGFLINFTAGHELGSAGELDAWQKIPQGSIVALESGFDWMLYMTG